MTHLRYYLQIKSLEKFKKNLNFCFVIFKIVYIFARLTKKPDLVAQ